MPAETASLVQTPRTAPLLTDAAGFAEMLNLSLSGFKNLRARGGVGPKAIRLGRSVRYSVRDIEQWIANSCLPADKWEILRDHLGEK